MDKYKITVECTTAQEAIDVVQAPELANRLRSVRDRINTFRERERPNETDVDKMLEAIVGILDELEDV